MWASNVVTEANPRPGEIYEVCSFAKNIVTASGGLPCGNYVKRRYDLESSLTHRSSSKVARAICGREGRARLRPRDARSSGRPLLASGSKGRGLVPRSSSQSNLASRAWRAGPSGSGYTRRARTTPRLLRGFLLAARLIRAAHVYAARGAGNPVRGTTPHSRSTTEVFEEWRRRRISDKR